MKKQGKVKAVSVTVPKVGMHVCVPEGLAYTSDKVFIIDNIDKGSFELPDSKELISELIHLKGYQFEVTLRTLKQLVVEESDYHQDSEGKGHIINNQYPLKYSQWQAAIDNGEVDSDKEVEFEVIERRGEVNGYYDGDMNQPSFEIVQIAKIIPAKKERVYNAEDMQQAFQAGGRRGYSQRSIMAGAKGTNDPDFDTWIKEYSK